MKCSKCKCEKSETDFYDIKKSWCKECTRHHRNTKGREKQLKKRYGITIVEYDKLLNKQNNCCAICNLHISKSSCNLAVDHCHKTLKIRGLLCFNCNQGLGRFKDNKENLLKAVSYLIRSIDEQHTNHDCPQ
jgi:hypothetical protein